MSGRPRRGGCPARRRGRGSTPRAGSVRRGRRCRGCRRAASYDGHDRRRRCARHVRRAPRRRSEVRAAVVPVQRRPQEERSRTTSAAGRRAGVAGRRPGGRPTTRSLVPYTRGGVDADGLAGVGDGALPAAELGEAGGVHASTPAVAVPRLAALLDRTPCGRVNVEVGGDAGLVVVDHEPGRRIGSRISMRNGPTLTSVGSRGARREPWNACCSPPRTIEKPQSRIPQVRVHGRCRCRSRTRRRPGSR